MRFLLTVVTVVAIVYTFVAAAASSKCPWSCKCSYKTKSAYCGKYRPGMKTIPVPPPYVKHYTFTNGFVPVVNRTTLKPLSNVMILSLALINDSITVLTSDVFTDFPQLVSLDLSSNKIPLPVLKSAFLSLGYQLTNLILSDTGIEFVPNDLLEANKSVNMAKINFSHNKLTSFNDSLFILMPLLETVVLNHNQISSYHCYYDNKNPNLRKLKLSYNWMSEIPNMCWPNGTVRYHRLRSLDIDNNLIHILHPLSTSCINNVQKITLNGNQMRVLENNLFNELHHLNTLFLANLPQLRIIKELAFNSTSLSKLDLSGNSRLTSNTFPGNFPFIWATKLHELSLQDTRIMLTLDLLKSMLLQLKSVSHLNLQRTEISKIPTGTLRHLPSLKILDLQGNYLAKWDDETFRNVTHLEYLNLDGNRISIINETSFPVEFRNSIKKINLGNNDFLCTCDLLWFRTWMNLEMKRKKKRIHFVNYPQRYYCKNPKRMRLDHFNPTAESCENPNPYMIAYVSTGTFVVVVVVVGLIVYRNRWNIRYCMYTLRRRQYQQLAGHDVELKYDVFVSFDSEDSDWMMEEVADVLENELNLRLCNHERDFEGGKMIIDNIVDCMDQSEKIILIVSNNFARSNWCKCEVKMALNQQFEVHKDIVVVIREMVARKYMFKSLKALLNTTTYIEWNEDEAGKRVFRNRLKEVMTRENIVQ